MDLRAEEEFHIIKAELINYQRRVMSTMYAKKYNALEIESTTEISKLRNQGRFVNKSLNLYLKNRMFY